MVLSLSSRTFVGLPLARDSAWLQIISTYLAEVVATAGALRPYPAPLRPFLRPFLAPKSRMDKVLATARAVISPVIEERRQSNDKNVDVLQFLISTSKVVDPMSVILKLLVVMSAAVSVPAFGSLSSRHLIGSIIASHLYNGSGPCLVRHVCTSRLYRGPPSRSTGGIIN
jgi:hypothetical protein